jgi:hypothetical protein
MFLRQRCSYFTLLRPHCSFTLSPIVRPPPTVYYSDKLVKLLPQKRSITSVETPTPNYNPEFKRTKQDSVTMSSAETVVPTVYGVCRPLGAEMKVVLSNREAQICDLLNDVAEHLKATRSDLPAVTLRIAGGWVRDKVRPMRMIVFPLHSFLIHFFYSY